jgi:hypothetical protein
MFFRINGTIMDLWLAEDQEPLTFLLEGAHRIEVVLERPSNDDVEQGHDPRHAFLRATSEFEPSNRIVAMFSALAEQRLPEPWAQAAEWPWSEHMNRDGSFREGFIPPMEAMPEPFQQFSRQTTHELWDAARRTALNLRWRLGERGRHSPFSSQGKEWSFDGHVFLPTPSAHRTYVEAFGTLMADAVELQDVLALVNNGKSEPLGHTLLREAWEQRHANPRSALVIGLAAAEVGLKECMSDLVPHARWLAENVPSPPLVSMLQDYVPLLPARLGIEGRTVAPPSRH